MADPIDEAIYSNGPVDEAIRAPKPEELAAPKYSPLPPQGYSPGEYVTDKIRKTGEHLFNIVSGIVHAPRLLGAIPGPVDAAIGAIKLGTKLGQRAIPPSSPEDYAKWRQENTEALIGLVNPTLAETYHGWSGVRPLTENLDPIFQDPGKAITDTLLNVPVTAMPAATLAGRAASALRGPISKIPGGGKAIGAADWLGRKIIPKYEWSEGQHLSDLTRQGQEFMGDITTRGYVEDTRQLLADNPLATKHLFPEFKKNRATGFRSYAAAPEFAALPPDQQNVILKFRDMVDTNHQLLYDRDIISKKEFTAGAYSYYHKMYKAHYSPVEWRENIPTSVTDNARNWLMQNLKNPENPALGLSADQADATIDSILTIQRKIDTKAEGVVRTYGSTSLPVAALIKRTQIPPEIRALLRPLGAEEAPILVGNTVNLQLKMLANDAAFERMTGLVANDGRPLLIPRGPKTGLATATAHGPYEVLGEDAAFGKYKGALVHPDIVDAIGSMKGSDYIRGALGDYIRLWKMGKVSWNVPTHINNILGDAYFAHLLGNSPFNPMNFKYYQQAGSEFFRFNTTADVANQMWPAIGPRQLPLLKEAIDDGVVIPGLVNSELSRIYSQVQSRKPEGVWREFFHTLMENQTSLNMAKAYEAEDQVHRYATYLKLRATGWTRDAARLEVNNGFPNYETMSPLGEWMRGKQNLGPIPAGVGPYMASPFSSFQLELMRITMNAARNHPNRLFFANMMPLLMTQAGMAYHGQTMEDYHNQIGKLPGYMRGKLHVAIPQPGEDNPYYLDLSNPWPGASWLEHQGGIGSSLIGNVPKGPLVDLFFNGLLPWAPLEILENRSRLTNQPLYDPEKGDTWGDAISQFTTRISPLPSSLIEFGQRSNRLFHGGRYRKYQEGGEEHSYLGELMRSLSPVKGYQAEELGTIGDKSQRGDWADLRGKRKGVLKDPRLGPDERQQRLDYINQERERLLKERK